MPVNSFENYPMSWRPRRSELRRPIYQSLAAQLEQDIADGFLPAGTKLPPQRELADYLDINFTTVTRAYKLCELKGLLYAVTGSGTYISGYAGRPAGITSEREGAPHTIDLAFAASFEQCNRLILPTLREVAALSYAEELLNYEHPTGMPHHRMAGVNWMRRLGFETDPEHVTIASGTLNAMTLALHALFSPGDMIAVNSFTFSNIIEQARMMRIQLVPIASDNQGMLPEELDARCQQGGIKGVFLIPSCDNPTTAMISETRKKALAQVIEARGLALIEDDMYAFMTVGIVSPEQYTGPLCRYLKGRYVYLCGMSKPLCSGLRVTYLAFSDDLKKQLLGALFNLNVKTSSLDAEIIARLILNGTADKILVRKKDLVQKANLQYNKRFGAPLPHQHPLPFYRWLSIDDPGSGPQVEQKYRKAGVEVCHAERFLCGKAESTRYLRISLATASEKDLEKGLDIVQELCGKKH